MNKNNTVLVRMRWVDNIKSNNYIFRLSNFLNPQNKPNITTPMFNEEILPLAIGKINKYNRFLICFDFDASKAYQQCFNFSSPKPTDSNSNLEYYRLPNKQKIMLKCPILIPTQYLEVANLKQMYQEETNFEVKRNISYNMKNLTFAIANRQSILYQYQCISTNTDPLNKFNSNDVLIAHLRMIDEQKTKQFCMEELQGIILKYKSQNNIS